MAELKLMKAVRLKKLQPQMKTTMRAAAPPVSVYDPGAYEGEETSPIVPEDDYLEPEEPKKKKKKGNKGIMIAVAAGAAVLLLSKK